MDKKVFIIIQARITSTRLPAKVMLSLCGKPILQILLERLGDFKESIIVATTNDGFEAPIVELCERLGYSFFRGDEKNVLDRFYNAAQEFGAKVDDVVVRICSDSPFLDGSIIKKLVDFYLSSDFEYVSNLGGHYPNGLEAEVFSFAVLREAYLNAKSDFDKEHVAPYIKRGATNGFFDDNADDYSSYKLTLDTIEDYLFLQQIASKMECNLNFSYEKLIETLSCFIKC